MCRRGGKPDSCGMFWNIRPNNPPEQNPKSHVLVETSKLGE
jgi:hypothetical protein